MTDLSGTHYGFLTFIGGIVGHVFCDSYDIMLLTKGEGPHLLATGNYELCLDQQSCVLSETHV